MREVDKFRRDGGDHLLYAQANKANSILILGGYSGQGISNINHHADASIYIIEPVKQYYDQLVKQYSDNYNVHILNVGVLDQAIVKNIDLNGDGTSLFKNSTQGVSCQFYTITEILQQFGITDKSIDLLWCNCEGGEYYALPELINDNSILQFNKLLIQYHDYNDFCKDTRNAIRASLQTLEYTEQFNYEYVWEYWKFNT